MNVNRIFIICIALLFCALQGVRSAHAGTLGKINGVVLDNAGNLLPGANVIIEGTRRGATTDAEGYFVILSVDPGEYSLTASMVGYRKVTQSNVQIGTDKTTTVNFELHEQTLEASEILVIAERPPVEPDKTTSKYTVTAEDIEQLSIVRSTAELVSLQPGVSQDGLFRLRGGDVGTGGWSYQYRPTDVAFVVDGVRVEANDGQNNPMFSGVNRSAIQEISVITGVTAAEYGNVQAGIINIVTKDGGQSYHGWAEYRNTPAHKKHWGENVYDAPIHRANIKWNDPTWVNETDPETGRVVHQRTDYTGVTGHEVQASTSGPLVKNISFLLSGKHTRDASPLPGPEKYGFTQSARFVPAPNNLQGSAALTWFATPNIKLKTGFLYQGYKSWFSGAGQGGDVFGFSAIANAGGVRGIGDNFRNLFLPDKYSSSGQLKFREDLEYVVLTHTLTPKTFYQVRLSRSRSFQDTLNTSTVNSTVRKDADKRFNLGAETIAWEIFDRKRQTLKVDLSSQITKGHFVKTGGELTFFDAWWTARLDPAPRNNMIEYFGGDRKIGEPVNPIEGALYAQDKMEFEGMVVNAGIRMDYFNPRTEWPVETTLFDRADTRYFTLQENIPMEPVDAQFHFSPRLGISHPITDKAAMHFSSGVFLQRAGFYEYYGQTYESNRKPHSLDLNKDGVIGSEEVWNNMQSRRRYWGDPRIRPERSLAFEVGGDWNFVTDYTLSLTTFYRAEWDQMGAPLTSWRDPFRRGRGANVRSNMRAEDVRGIELSLRKDFSHNFAFQLAYNMQWSDITHVVGRGGVSRRVAPDSKYIVENWTYKWDIDPNTGARIRVPLTDADIQRYGTRADNHIKSLQRLLDIRSGGGGVLAGYWDIGFQMEGPEGEKGLYFFGLSQMRGIHTWGGKPGDRRNSGKIQFLFSTPPSSEGSPAGRIFSDMNINVLYRVQNGVTFEYSPPIGGAKQWRSGPLQSRFDIEAQKTFRLGNTIQTSLFASVFNLFNDGSVSRVDSSVDWVQWGLDQARPDNPDLRTYGDLNDYRRLVNKPRNIELGVRLRF